MLGDTNRPMKRESGGPSSIATVAMLLLQLFVGLVLPLYHAQVEAQEFTHEVHISAPATSDCVPHNDIGCQICRSTGNHILLVAGNFILPPQASARLAPRDQADSGQAGQFELFGGFGPRAPPTF